MAFKLLLILLAIFSPSLGQTISCDHWSYAPAYFCDMSINNPTGYDAFTGIGGTHEPGMTNADVTHLSTSGTTSSNIPRIICDTFPNLEVFHFSHLGTTTISANAFTNCARVQSIDVYSNLITTIAPTAFANNRELYHLSIANNQLASLSATLIQNLVNLEEFEANRNMINDIPSTFFNGLTRLRDVRLMSNQLSTWHTSWFSDKVSLTYVDLGQNRLTSIPNGVLHPANIVKNIYVDHNQLSELRLTSFGIVRSLQYLYASDNHINHIDRAMLEVSNSPDLYGLDLYNNTCISQTFYGFNDFRADNLATLAPCF